jgi:hypothetical protein
MGFYECTAPDRGPSIANPRKNRGIPNGYNVTLKPPPGSVVVFCGLRSGGWSCMVLDWSCACRASNQLTKCRSNRLCESRTNFVSRPVQSPSSLPISDRASVPRFDKSDFFRFSLKSFTGLSVKPYEDVVRPAPLCDNVFICFQMFMERCIPSNLWRKIFEDRQNSDTATRSYLTVHRGQLPYDSRENRSAEFGMYVAM